ncbi:class I SAM-dependent methyltransferase [Paucibacter sp. DJ1R-11]|uniref:class I SAM-dependent DNA methyltransferase n=1 Tax=Paucibacter sp. DJ1R-11 TaxID=2893556 RepID=UPI0021E4B690|nr:class I SAM-dependent methyltransferase [Paucibacter sp. DJ1R-11]MCV2363068.1 class I SAM-dependent methyltransferase [Paucibacter sp. DJ1R-11]
MSEDYNAESVACFDRHAQRYAEKYFELRDYDRFYRALAEALPPNGARFLDLACGPGNAAAFVRQACPSADILCVDRSPAMLVVAGQRVRGAVCQQADCRDLRSLAPGFDAAAFCFALSYFDDTDARRVLAELARLLRPGATLLLSSVSGDPAHSGPQHSSSGDRVFMVYRRPTTLAEMLIEAGFAVDLMEELDSPANASQKTVDVLMLARRNSVPAD